MTDEIRPYGPGKFSTILDSYVHALTLDGGADEEESYPDGGGWYGLLRGPFEYESEHDRPRLNAAEISELTGSIGVILYERSDGIVESEWFETSEALESAWAHVQDEFADVRAEELDEASADD